MNHKSTKHAHVPQHLASLLSDEQIAAFWGPDTARPSQGNGGGSRATGCPAQMQLAALECLHALYGAGQRLGFFPVSSHATGDEALADAKHDRTLLRGIVAHCADYILDHVCLTLSGASKTPLNP